MKVPYTIWRKIDETTGEIVANGGAPTEKVAKLQLTSEQYSGCQLFLGEKFSGTEHYMLNGVPTPRPAFPMPTALATPADGETELMYPLPAGTKITFEGVTGVLEDGFLHFRTAVPGVFTILVEPPWPMLTHSVEVVAYAA